MTDIVVVKGDPSPEELAALTVALLTVASRCPAPPRRGHRGPPAAAAGRAVVPTCGCA